MNTNPFKNLFKVDASYWLLVLPVLHVTVPWVQYRLRGIIPFVFAMMWLLPKVSKIMAKFSTREGRAFFKALLWFLCLMFMPELFAIIGSQKHMKYYQVATFATQIVFLIVAFYTIAYHKFNELRFLTIGTIGGFILAGISAVRGLGVEGLESGRNMTTLQNAGHMISQETVDKVMTVVEYGLGAYSYIYYCAWIVGIAMFAFIITKDVKLRTLYCALGFCAALSVKMGGLGTPLGIVVIETIIFLIWIMTRSRRAVAICGYSVVALFFVYAAMPQMFGFLADPFDAVAKTMSEGSFKDRVISMAESFRGMDSYAIGRAQLQMKSFRTFCQYPLFGAFGPFAGGSQMDLGGHSYLLDILGGYGLFGLFVFIMFIWSLLKYFRALGQMYFGSRWLVMPAFFMSVFVFSAIMNPIPFFANAVYLLPGIAWLALSTQEREAMYWRLGNSGWNPGPYRYIPNPNVGWR